MTPEKKKKIPSLPQLLGNDTDIQEFYRNCPFQEIVNVTGTLLHATVTAPFRRLQPQQTTPDIQHSPHDSVDTLPQGCMLCNNFYVKYIVLSGASMAALEASTRSQANYLWHVSRRLRIMASNIRRIPKRVTTPAEKAFQSITSPNFYGNAATQHGINHEVVARLQFQKDFGLDAVQRGIYVCKDKPWLSATPDGIIESHCAILEIKCPFTQDSKVIRSGKYDVVEKGGVHILNKNGPSGYYSQVQFTMLCTEKQLCFLYVWSPKSAVLIEVPIDPCYVTHEMPRLQRFYFCKMLPCLQGMKSEGKLDLSEYEKIEM
ncbi:uncharacterized protein LOC125944380 [Dermacentor silvarum]|uniref:uncharacterized protein LOC125944380 n=1 Tax=Dermacentor silvarum TaxID=543639 RepID=UPI0021018E87|nr:uncharacterized protein LOC125944380 [Dermacentor silvarum]